MEQENLTFEKKIEAIKQDVQKIYTVTPWEIANHFGYLHRSWGLAERVNQFLEANEVELSSDFYQANFYAELTLKHKEVATTKVTTDPIKRVDSLAAATNNKPVFVERNSSLSHAITLMQQNGYSQLPVVSGGERNLCGYISWKTIGLGLWHKTEGDLVKDYMISQITAIPKNAPLLDAIQTIARQKFVIVLNEDRSLSGIVTASDIAAEFFTITQAEAFLLLEQIELLTRKLLGQAGLLVEDLQSACQEDGREVNFIDDLTFGEYCKIIENPKNWRKLNIIYVREDFVKFMDETRKIRNKVMHFERDGIDKKDMQTLRNMSRYLSEIAAMTNKKE